MEKNNKISPKVLFSILGALVLCFSGIIIINEYTLVSGEEVFLKTVPVDPRDILRGDYVILRYEIERNEKVKTFIAQEKLSAGDVFYLILNKDEKDLATLDRLALEMPKEALYIKGAVGKGGWRGAAVELGIGKYFVPEKRGREVERIRGGLTVLVSVDKLGKALIKDLYYKEKKIDFKNDKIL